MCFVLQSGDSGSIWRRPVLEYKHIPQPVNTQTVIIIIIIFYLKSIPNACIYRMIYND